VDHPLNRAKMLAWNLREWSYDRLGRDPQAHTLVERDLARG
jgi:hypothetical protein